MDTPICDFVAEYIRHGSVRLHMPGHKGERFIGCEELDITEIPGADSLYDATGIIRQSERNAGELFGARTFYSTEGSSLAIRAMLALVTKHARGMGRAPIIWAGRNAHSAFLSAAALLDLSVEWILSQEGNYLSCPIDPSALDERLGSTAVTPAAVYVTSPDYLGSQADISAIASVCHRYGVLLLVDNAHGAYLRFLPRSMHPMDLGADMCCDSAHKTLPVLTGGAYLHLSHGLDGFSDSDVREAMRLFGSTSPSYLILESLDAANRYLADSFGHRLRELLPRAEMLRDQLSGHGYRLIGTEPLKITIMTKSMGYTGAEISEILSAHHITAEFSDPDHIVFMLTPSLRTGDLERLGQALLDIPRRSCDLPQMPQFSYPAVAMSIREAALSPFETLPVEECVGRVLAVASVGCPPAVPILVCGEVVDERAVECFRYYGIRTCNVVKALNKE